MKCFPFVLVLFLLSCNTAERPGNKESNAQPNSEGTKSDNQPSATTKNITGCYMRVLKRDTLALHIQQDGNSVSGRLSFDNYEKDGSTGSVSGTIDGEIVKLIYSFQSEGMNSVMQVFFKISENGLIHGLGEVNVKGDTAFYAQPSNISYPSNNKLENIPCENLPPKFK